MTNEDKQILLQDLCARLPYGVKVEINGYYIHVLTGIDGDTISTDRGINYPLRLVKPFLRPLSSMTKEEKKVYDEISHHLCGEVTAKTMIHFLNAHHLDYNGLIEKGLGLEAPKGMYETIK